jgi:UDP-2,3-diacylglucosamine hydrolase
LGGSAASLRLPDIGRVPAANSDRRSMIIITDAHISPTAGNAARFFALLRRLERTTREVVFLGDIFDLWIALPAYEDPAHRRFLAWCRQEKQRRMVGFVEGNREYFVPQAHREAFTWCDSAASLRRRGTLLLAHGYQIDERKRVTRLFLRCTKNALARRAMRGLPGGPRLSRCVQQGYRAIIPVHQGPLPADEIRTFAEDRFRQGVRLILSGHFHRAYTYRGRYGGVFHALPDWFATGLVTLCDPARGEVQHVRDDAPEIRQLSTSIDFDKLSV